MKKVITAIVLIICILFSLTACDFLDSAKDFISKLTDLIPSDSDEPDPDIQDSNNDPVQRLFDLAEYEISSGWLTSDMSSQEVYNILKNYNWTYVVDRGYDSHVMKIMDATNIALVRIWDDRDDVPSHYEYNAQIIITEETESYLVILDFGYGDEGKEYGIDGIEKILFTDEEKLADDIWEIDREEDCNYFGFFSDRVMIMRELLDYVLQGSYVISDGNIQIVGQGEWNGIIGNIGTTKYNIPIDNYKEEYYYNLETGTYEY